MGKKFKFFKISYKITIMVMLMVIICSVSVGGFSFLHIEQELFHLKGLTAQTASVTLASVLGKHALAIQTLSQTEEDGEFYEFLKQLIGEVGERMPSFASLYIVTKTDTHFKFIYGQNVIGDDTRPLGFLEPLEIWPEASIRAYDTGANTYSEPYEYEDYGMLITGYSPIFNDNGSVIAIVGFDIYLADIIKELNNIRAGIILIISVSLLLFAVASVLYTKRSIGDPITKLSIASNRIVNGDMGGLLQINSKDELGMLSENFGKMQLTINILQQDIRGIVKNAANGVLRYRAQADKYPGVWSEVAVELNNLLEAITVPIDELDSTLNAIANGDFNVRITNDYKGDFARIRDSVNTMAVDIKKYNEILIEKARLEFELEAAKNLAEAKAEARTRFIANISHDIRTPMNGIIGLAELGLANVTDFLKQQDYLTKIKCSAEGLLDIINDILDFSKIDTGVLTLENTPFYLQDVLNECETIIRHGMENKGITLNFYNETGLSNEIIGDPTKLRRALINFLTNAVKFTKEGYVTFTIKCDIISKDKNMVAIYFEIKDTGIGMSKEQCATIFEPFTQADDSTTRNYGGTGLGLYITNNIIEKMGGKIQVESVVGAGSTFSFSIEFKLSLQKNASHVTRDSRAIALHQPMFDANVLVCEDNELNRQIIVENLKKLGLTVYTAENGKLGIEAIRNSKKTFDIILMDIQMPVLDGVNTTKMIKEMGFTMPIIAMTANILPEDRRKYVSIGMSDCLCKPFKQQDLWVCLAKYLNPIGEKQVSVHINSQESRTKNGKVIDVEIGIENCAGSESLYKKMLINYLKKCQEQYLFLEKAIDEQNYDIAFKISHKENGIAAMIGASKLSERLSDLEGALKPYSFGWLRKMTLDYKEELNKVINYTYDMNLDD